MLERDMSMGGGGNVKKSPSYGKFVALGLSALLPSFAFSSESDEALTQLLSTAPSNPSDSKTQTLENYSPVVDLRTSRATNYTEVWSQAQRGNKTWNSDAHILIQDSPSQIYGNINFVSNANVVFDIQNSSWADNFLGIVHHLKGFYIENVGFVTFSGSGTFTYNFTGTAGGNDEKNFLNFFDDRKAGINLTSRFVFNAIRDLDVFLRVGIGGANKYGNGVYTINSPFIQINMKNETNGNSGKYFIYNKAYYDGSNISFPDFFINANTDGSINNQSSIQQYNGDIYFSSGRLFMHLTNSQSFLDRKSVV